VPEINVGLMRKYLSQGMKHELLKLINSQIASQIQAGLTFGDLKLVSPEINWARKLIANNAIPQAVMDDYLSTYIGLVQDTMGDNGTLILDWLRTQ
jgi:hypothetical protein